MAYHNINYTQGVSNGVHGLLVFDDEIYMCLASDNYDGKGTPGEAMEHSLVSGSTSMRVAVGLPMPAK